MAVPSSKCYALIVPVLLLVLIAGLVYNTGFAFRIRDPTPGSTVDVCPSGKCNSVRPKRTFETASQRGSFAKTQNLRIDLEHGTTRVKDKPKLWSKLTYKEDVSDVEDEEDGDYDGEIDSDDEIIQIEVEDEDEVVVDDQEDKTLKEKLRKEEQERTEKRKKEKEELERKRKEEEERKRKELEQEKKRKDEEKKKKEEAERNKREEIERRLKEEAERRLREREEEERIKREEEKRLKEEERRREEEEERKRKLEEEERKQREKERKRKEEEEQKRREEVERMRKEEEERKRKEAEDKKRKEELERKRKEEEERKRKEVEERKRKEEAERKQREEEERKRKEVEEKKRKEEAERNQREEEERKRKELKEEEEQRLKEEEEIRLRAEAERLEEEEECRLKEEEDERKKQEEERLRKEKAEKAKREKEEAEKKKRDREELEAERKRKQEEAKIRAEKLKKETEEKRLREEAARKKKAKVKDDDNGDENGDDEDVSAKSEETVRVQSKPKTVDSKPKSIVAQQKSASDAAKLKSKKTFEMKASQTLADLNDLILSAPSFVPNFTAVEDSACQQHGKIFLRQLRGYKLWALQMLDSSAKIPSGLLRGNVNQLGDFDQCLESSARVKIDEKTIKVQGKYCLASLDLYSAITETRIPVNLMQGRALIRGNMRDPGHFVPKFTTVNWAICLPAACSAEDAQRSIENALDSYNMTIGIKFVVNVDSKMCYVKQKPQSFSKETIGVLYFFAFIVCLSIVATFRDYFATLSEKGNYSERIIMSFSLKRTLRALFKYKEASPSDIGCIHGIRTLSTIALYVAHKLIPTSRMPYVNRVSLTEIASNPLSTLLRSSLFYTDSFLLLSGVLTAFNMAQELQKRGEIRWFCRLIARYMRLTPCLVAVVFWYAFVMEHTGSGPQWNSVVKSNADICKENSWINLLYVQNFFPFEEMCATHTHQLALDMQLFLIAPALVFFLQVKPILGIVIVFFMIQVSATLRYFATSNNNLSLVIFHGMTMKHLYKTANLSYMLPLHRATPYLLGVSLGVFLHYTGKKLRLHKIFVIIGWLLAIASGSWSLFSPWKMSRRDYVYNVEEATHYAVMSPILSALSLSWIIFACFTNNGGFVNRFLSSYWMVVLSRLSYAIYLCQFAVFFYNVGTTRYASEFHPFQIVNPYEAICVVSVSIVLTVLFDIPMQEVKNIIMESSDSLAVENEKSKEGTTAEENHNGISKTPRELMPDEEDEPGGWNWNRGTFTRGPRPSTEPRDYDENGIDDYRSSRFKRQDVRRQTIVRSETYDEWNGRGSSRRTSMSEDDGRTSRSEYRLSNASVEDDLREGYLHPRERYFSGNYSRSPMRDLDAPIFRRSSSRERPLSKEQERDYSKKPLITISKEDDYYNSHSPRSSMIRLNDQQRSLSSESEDPISSRRSSYTRRLSGEPRINDEDDWEDDLRIRRNRYLQERVSSQERERIPPPVVEEASEEELDDSLRRRSSAEGKLALLKEPLRPGNMELWTVSKMQLGSSQEPEDEDYEELYLQQRREYREKQPPLREEFEDEEIDERKKSFATESLPTSFEDDEVQNQDSILNRNSKMVTVQDLSKLSSEEEEPTENNWNRLDVKTGLFKRESIVKSQASEEDPEYLLPERPKLVEQEQEHPFKKAWQMQKSRSEEEGSSAFIIREPKPSLSLEKQREELEDKRDYEEQSSDRDGAQFESIPEPDVTCEVTLVWQPRNYDIEDTRSNATTKSSSSISSVRFDWPDDDDLSDNHRNRRKSDQDNWTWTERDT